MVIKFSCRLGGLLVVATLAWLVSCKQLAKEDRTELCTQQCSQAFDCQLEDNPYSTITECVDECSKPDGFLWEHEECTTQAEAMTSCIAGLSCAEYLAHHTDLENSPCRDVTEMFAACRAQQTP